MQQASFNLLIRVRPNNNNTLLVIVNSTFNMTQLFFLVFKFLLASNLLSSVHNSQERKKK